MLVGAAVAAGGELIGAAAAAGAAGLAAADIAEEAAGDASSLEGAGAAAGDGAGADAGAAPKPAAAESSSGESPAEPDSTGESNPAEPVGCKNSFAAGTAVLMADGSTKPIQDINVGDQITNKDPATGQLQTHTVMATHITDDDRDFVNLTVQTTAGVASITTTAHHLFWDVVTSSWTTADSLNVGDRLDSPGDGNATVVAVRLYADALRTFNLTVDGVHTYYVLAGLGAVLVHNCPDGGKYGSLKPSGQGNEVNHMPQNASTPLSMYNGPAIRMLRDDHRALYSTGSYIESRAWLMMQRELVDAGRVDEAMMNDINDVVSRFPYKYNNAIGEMIGSLAKNAAYQAIRTVPGEVSVQLTLW